MVNNNSVLETTEPQTDNERRLFLTTAATIVGSVGVAAGSFPFIASFAPSAKTLAIGAPVEVDISDLGIGDQKIVGWRGRPVWILRRDIETINSLQDLNEKLADPNSEDSEQPIYAQNEHRSEKPEYLVVIGICTHLGCSPTLIPADSSEQPEEDWKGGFYCSCHGSRFDFAGRVFKNVPAPTNLVIPPYRFISPTRLLIGEDNSVA